MARNVVLVHQRQYRYGRMAALRGRHRPDAGNQESRGVLADQAYRVSDQAALTIVLISFLREEGLFLGLSSGINIAGAAYFCPRERGAGPKPWSPSFATRVTGTSRSFSMPEWLAAHGLASEISLSSLLAGALIGWISWQTKDHADVNEEISFQLAGKSTMAKTGKFLLGLLASFSIVTPRRPAHPPDIACGTLSVMPLPDIVKHLGGWRAKRSAQKLDAIVLVVADGTSLESDHGSQKLCLGSCRAACFGGFFEHRLRSHLLGLPTWLRQIPARRPRRCREGSRRTIG